MIIAVDIGNTTVEIGFVKDKKFIKSYRLSSDLDKTSDDWVLNLLQIKNIENNSIRDIVISSVVPKLEKTLISSFEKAYNKKPLIIGKDLKVPIKNNYKNPSEVGIDRLVNAYSAINKVNPPIIVVDLGTAITFDVISEEGAYEGGAIFPGINSSLYALFSKTSKLPMVEIDKPEDIVGKTTVESIKSGIYFGYCSLIDGMIERISKGKNYNIILTGGNSKLISNCIESKHMLDEYLAMEGIYLIYQYNLLYSK